MHIIDRLLTILVTALATSAVWIIAGGTIIELASGDGQRAKTSPAQAASRPDAGVDAGTKTGAKARVDAGADAGGQTGAEKGDVVASSGAQSPPQQEGEDSAPSLPIAAPLDEGNPTALNKEQTLRLIIPVLNIRPADLSDSFAQGRDTTGRLHEAIDIMAPEGTSVVAAAPGTIEKLHVSRADGNSIYVRSSDGQSIHYYAHLAAYARGLREGQRIRRGQRLGAVGSTGKASPDTPHLHFAILRTTRDAKWWEPANAVNPYPLLSGRTP